jgi:hypothetical protein
VNSHARFCSGPRDRNVPHERKATANVSAVKSTDLGIHRPPRKKEEHRLSLTLVEKRKRIRIIHHP